MVRRYRLGRPAPVVVPRLDLVVVMNFGDDDLPSLEQSGIGNTVILQAVLPTVA